MNYSIETFLFIAYVCLNIPINHYNSSIDTILWAIEQELKHYPKTFLKKALTAYINNRPRRSLYSNSIYISKKMQSRLEKFIETIPYIETKEGKA